MSNDVITRSISIGIFDAAYNRSKIPPLKTISILSFVTATLTILSIVQYSRLLTIFFPYVATLGITLIISGLIMGLFSIHRKFGPFLLFISISNAAIFYYSLIQFSKVTGIDHDIRTIGTFSGLFLTSAFYILFINKGVRDIARTLAGICLVYCAVYCAASITLSVLGSLGNAGIGNAILFDHVRGRRVFSNTVCISYVLIYGWYNLTRIHKVFPNLLCFLIGMISMYLTQSRMATLSSIIICLLIVVRGRRLISILSLAIPFLYFTYSVIMVKYLDEVMKLLIDLDATSLSFRSDSLYLAKYVFGNWPYFGVGLPSDIASYTRILSKPFYPEDLGGIGLISNFGLYGLGWFCLILILVSRGIFVSLKYHATSPIGYCGLYILIYGFTWPTFIYGDGTIFSAILIALGCWHADHSSKKQSVI